MFKQFESSTIDQDDEIDTSDLALLLNDEDSKRRSKDSNYHTQDPTPFDFERPRQSKTKKPKFAAES